MAKSIGIDLGTTNSVAGIKKVYTEIIKNAEGDLITPSCVSAVTKEKKPKLFKFRSNNGVEFKTGKHALEWIKQDPENTVTGVKRLMGRSWHNAEIQKIINEKLKFYKIVRNSRGSENSLAIILKGHEYSPEQLSAKILEKIRIDAESFLNDTVDYAVITVPAYFNDKQKHATRTAAALSGLKVKRLLSEPTAAAISFGVDTVKNEDAQTVLVFDFGGGTFDLSILTISGGQFIEQGKGGNMWLGGEDIDHIISDYVLSEAAKEYDIENMDEFIESQDSVLKNRFLGELKIAVEAAKINLSEQEEAYIEILGVLKDQDGDLVDVDVALSRETFNEMIAPMVTTMIQLIRSLLEEIHFSSDLIDKVLLVGGSSKIPLVINALQNEFGEEKVMLHDRPMLAIAEGASILSHRLADTYECPGCGIDVLQTEKVCAKCAFNLEEYIIDQGVFDIVHAAAHDYYICLENDEKHLLVDKNTPLPVEHTEVFKLVHPEQQLVNMKFINMVNENEESIGDLWIGIDNEDRRTEDVSPQIEITIRIDENNLVEVMASLKEVSDVGISKTLSRGNADEKLFIDLEKMIDSINAGKYDEYVAIDITKRSLSIIKDIHQVIDKETGQTVEEYYKLAENKIDKAEKMAKAEMTSRPLIYYAESMLDDFGAMLSKSKEKEIKEKVKKLREMDDKGSYEENVAAYHDLDDTLDDLGLVNILKAIQHAGILCEEHEPSQAPKFYDAIQNIMKASIDDHYDEMNELIGAIIPEIKRVREKYDSREGTVYKNITK